MTAGLLGFIFSFDLLPISKMLSISPVEGIICHGWQIKLARQDADASDPIDGTNSEQKTQL